MAWNKTADQSVSQPVRETQYQASAPNWDDALGRIRTLLKREGAPPVAPSPEVPPATWTIQVAAIPEGGYGISALYREQSPVTIENHLAEDDGPVVQAVPDPEPES